MSYSSTRPLMALPESIRAVMQYQKPSSSSHRSLDGDENRCFPANSVEEAATLPLGTSRTTPKIATEPKPVAAAERPSLYQTQCTTRTAAPGSPFPGSRLSAWRSPRSGGRRESNFAHRFGRLWNARLLTKRGASEGAIRNLRIAPSFAPQSCMTHTLPSSRPPGEKAPVSLHLRCTSGGEKYPISPFPGEISCRCFKECPFEIPL